MNTQALIWMVTAYSVVIFMAGFYFIKILRTPPKDPKHDSYTET